MYNNDMAIPYTDSQSTFKYNSLTDLVISDWQNILNKILHDCGEMNVSQSNKLKDTDVCDIENETPDEEHRRILEELDFEMNKPSYNEHKSIMKSISELYPELTKVDDCTMITAIKVPNEKYEDDTLSMNDMSVFDDSTMLTATAIQPTTYPTYEQSRKKFIEDAEREARESTQTRVKMETISQANYLRADLKNMKRNKLYTNISLGCAIFSIIFWPVWFLSMACRYVVTNHTLTGNIIFGVTALVGLIVFAFLMMLIREISKRSRHYKTQIAKTKSELYKLNDSFLSDKEVKDKYKFRENDDACGELDEE